MSGGVDLLVVSCLILAAVGYAFFSLAPRAWRVLALGALASLALGMPPLSGLARRLNEAANRFSATGGCGGCGDCGSAKPSGESAPRADVRVPLSSLRRRR